ncbi:unnamed protein product [Rhizoctonia solani]|uniref:F-box domain-containing protein n=1 Tax=Rhizoctonia solani TaxID=456999 RepID=A0A8H2Y281_9AGAM|nr:unnamed protein product [Rhizoctonia solani]
MPLSRLLFEITAHIISYLEHPHLISASLVCKAWRLVLIPALHRSVLISSGGRAIQFAHTITSGGVVGSPSYITQSIRSLRIATPFRDNGCITSLGLAALESSMTYLTELRQFHCDVHNQLLINNTGFIKLAQTQCPKLETASFDILGGLGIETHIERLFATLLGFRNLVDYSLKVSYIVSGLSVETLRPLESLAVNCPGLESLKLDFSFEEYKGVTFYSYTPDMVAHSFGTSTMPLLHTLHLLGGLDQHLESFSDSLPVGPHPFRDFLLRHPRIKDFKIGGPVTDRKSPDISSENLARAFPSLKHVSAPNFVCADVLRSTLATQIESLDVQIGSWGFELEGEFEPFPMPMLRQLHIREPGTIGLFALMRPVMPVVGGLEELRIQTRTIPCASHLEFLELLAYAPNLQTIGTHFFSRHPECEALIEEIKSRYPKANIIEDCPFVQLV